MAQASQVPLPESEDEMQVDKSIQAVMERSGAELGPLASQYLSQANDGTFGLTFDIGEQKLKVGNSNVTVKNDDIVIDKTNERYSGTPGLWRLLTQSGDVGSEQYTQDDRNAYKQILIDTGAIYQSNDPATGRPKSSQGHKWKKIIKPMWEELRAENVQSKATGKGLKTTGKGLKTTGQGLKNHNSLKRVQKSGSGLIVDTDCPVEYKYISKYADLIERLYFLQAEETAGNNNFHNEKMGIAKFISERLLDCMKTPNGEKYVMRCMLAIPKKDSKYVIDQLKNVSADDQEYVKDLINYIHDALEAQVDLPDGPMYLARCLAALPEKIVQGSGILNTIINKLPFELHPYGMRFLGPGTKLEKRLARGDKGANPLDEAAKEHDIWYSKHKRTEDRWVADKVLQDKAFGRVIAPDASLYERPLALATGTAMWLKRKMGMGLLPIEETSYTRNIPWYIKMRATRV